MDPTVRMDRDAVRRVLRRATALSGEHDAPMPEIDDRIDAEALVEAAGEVDGAA